MKKLINNKTLISVIISVSVSCIIMFLLYVLFLKPNNINYISNDKQLGDTNILYDSSNVSYDNGSSGISSNNVQDAIDELYGDAVDYSSILTRLTAIENKIYPVGSIYISVDSTNPSTIFGGTWIAFGTGKTLVGIDTNDTDFDTVEEAGGAKSVTIETANLPSHTHTVTAAGSVGAHTHTVTAKGSVGGHTHTVTAKGTVSSSFSGSSTNTSSSGSHTHTMNYNGGGYAIYAFSYSSGSSGTGLSTNNSGTASWTFSSSGAHTHAVTAKGSVSSSFSGQSTNTGSTTPSFTGQSTNTGSATPTFTGSSTNTSAVGSATPTAISTMNPYITVYMWKRTA